MKRIVSALLIVCLAACLLCGCGGSKNKAWTGKHTVEITVKDYGTITAQINCDAAPATGSNFLNLVNRGFYNKTTVYRAIDGFAIYCGKASNDNIYGEFNSNGFNNILSNTRGAIGMCRGINKDSATAQFYILQSDVTWLDGEFAVFGQVTSGLDIVDQIAGNVEVSGADGNIPDNKQPTITSIKVID